MQNENLKHSAIHYVGGALWKICLAAVSVFLVERLVQRGCIHRNRHVPPIITALSVVYALVFAAIAAVLIYLLVKDCQDMYEAVVGDPELAKRSPTTAVPDDHLATVFEERLPDSPSGYAMQLQLEDSSIKYFREE